MADEPEASEAMSSHPPHSMDASAVHALASSDANQAKALGKYRVLGALGSGGMADVFLAVADGPEGFRKLCVVKLLKEDIADDGDFRAMFLDEARLAARLNHPNIVQTFEVDESDGRLLLAMEYVEGQPLTRVVRYAARDKLPLVAFVRILCDILEALDYAHTLTDYDGTSLGIVHRDVTPHNVLVGYDGRVKLVDFGIAKSAAAVQLTQAGIVKGKVGYMAPEQATGADVVDGRADIFSVGVILWEAIAQQRLTAGMSAREIILRRIAGGEPKITSVAPGVDPALASICDRALATDPDERYAHAGDMQLALEQWLSTQKEPSRKLWGAELRRVFENERRQLRHLIEQRLRDAGVEATLRRKYTANATSSILALTPDAASQIARAPSVPPSETGSDSSIRGRSVSLPPEPPRSWTGLIVGASMLTAAVAALVYVTQLPSAPPPPAAPAPAVAPPPAASAPMENTAPVSSAALVTAPVDETPAVDPSTLRPHAGGGAPRRGHGAAPVAPAPSTPRTAEASPQAPKPKASARTLDEQDPYR